MLPVWLGPSTLIRRLIGQGLVGIGLMVLLGGPAAWAQDDVSCTEAIAAAEEAYRNADFEVAIRRVSVCLEQSDIPTDQVVRAYRLLSLAHLRLNELQQARAAIVNIFGLRPRYEADPIEDPPEYVSLVSIVRREVRPEAPPEEPIVDERTPFFKRGSTWLSILGSIAVGGAVTFLTLGQGSGDDGGTTPPTGPDPLPPPPGTPSGN
jgi:hypothetical protein